MNGITIASKMGPMAPMHIDSTIDFIIIQLKLGEDGNGGD